MGDTHGANKAMCSRGRMPEFTTNVFSWPVN